MRTDGDTWVLGLDATKHGWAGIHWSGGDTVRGVFGPTIQSAVAAAGAVDTVAIDIPIGLPDTSRRLADELARKAVGPRRSSVFSTPIRAALETETYAEALDVSRHRAGFGLSAQAYALRGKVLEVDAFLRSSNVRIVEVHPEVCFAAMNGEPVAWSKRTWRGMNHRHDLLKAAGIGLPQDLGAVGEKAGADDVLDAGAAAWTAMRVSRGEASCLPEQPEVFSDGWPAAIWV